MQVTKIVATLGPATDRPEIIRKLVEAGADVFRLNASHGSQDEHRARIHTIRQVAGELGSHAGILLDLQGPKIRLGEFENGGCVLQDGARFTLTTKPVMGTCECASTTYPEFARDVKEGDRVLLADGAIELRVLSTDDQSAECLVVTGGPVSDRKGINLPGVRVSTPSLTKKDLSDLRFGLAEGIDFVALSFVRRRDDVLRLRIYLEEQDAQIPIIAKIEKPEAWENFDQILEETDGVMVARGDLGVEMPIEKVPLIQKAIIERARQRGKFVITATQMLESMVQNATPTRAEVSDVANAIFDGTDAVMLSAETSVGAHPVEAVRLMSRIAQEAEQAFHFKGFRELPSTGYTSYTEIMADAAYRMAHTASAAAIVVFTSSGASARRVARYRPPVPIFAFTPSPAVARQLGLIYAVVPMILPNLKSTDEMMAAMDKMLQEKGWLKPRDGVVFVAGQPIGRPGSTNLIKLHRVGELR